MIGANWNVVALPVTVSNTLSAQARVEGLSRSQSSGELVSPANGPFSLSNVSGIHAQISQVKDRLTETAQTLRQINTSLTSAVELLGEIKANLTGIIKQYPPFAQEAPQRIAYLNAITGLRKQLESLSFPPAHTTQPFVQELGAGLEWLASSPPIPKLPTSTDLSVPELDPDLATDAQVKAALAMVSDAQVRLDALREGMWQDVSRFAGDDLARQAQSLIETALDSLPAGGVQGISGDGIRLSEQGI